jgi:hypothetical protein
VSFAAITFFVASQRVIPKVSAYFVIDSVRKRLDTPSFFSVNGNANHHLGTGLFVHKGLRSTGGWLDLSVTGCRIQY